MRASHFRSIFSGLQRPLAHTKSDSFSVELSLDELLAQRVYRAPARLGRGKRGPDGERAGRGRAHSMSFDGVSPYQVGDQPRWVDWRATARSGTIQVKRFAAHSQRARMIVLRIDSSLMFATHLRLMAKTAALMAARLAYESHYLGEPVGLVCSGQQALPAKRGRFHLRTVLETVHRQYQRTLAQRNQNESGDSGSGVTNATDALDVARSFLRSGDEICFIDELLIRDKAFESWSSATATYYPLHYYPIRDSFTDRPVPAGRYPAILFDNARSVTWQVRATSINRANQNLKAGVAKRIEYMSRLGWSVSFADDFLSGPERELSA